jgi:hypothetical protein
MTTTRELLAQHAALLNKHGPYSCQELRFVQDNQQSNPQFAQLAEVARWLKEKLTAVVKPSAAPDVPSWPLEVVPLPARYPGEDESPNPRPITGYMIMARTGATVRKVALLEASHYLTVEQAEAYARLFVAAANGAESK